MNLLCSHIAIDHRSVVEHGPLLANIATRKDNGPVYQFTTCGTSLNKKISTLTFFEYIFKSENLLYIWGVPFYILYYWKKLFRTKLDGRAFFILRLSLLFLTQLYIFYTPFDVFFDSLGKRIKMLEWKNDYFEGYFNFNLVKRQGKMMCFSIYICFPRLSYTQFDEINNIVLQMP